MLTTGNLAIFNIFAEDAALEQQFVELRPVLQKYCLECHSTKTMEGELDLERFTSVTHVREDVKPWQAMIQQLETGEMPPKDEPQPTDVQRSQLIEWSRALLDSEARARAGDPGHVPMHRLSNTEYNNTIRDLTGIDLQPTREFPADGAAGEGFTNAAEALTMSPALMSKYVNASKQIAAHAVLLPDGFRFSPSATRRDWTDENLAELRNFYRQFTQEGSLPLKPFATIRILVHSTRLTTLSCLRKRNRTSPQLLKQPMTKRKQRRNSQRDISLIPLGLSDGFPSSLSNHATKMQRHSSRGEPSPRPTCSYWAKPLRIPNTQRSTGGGSQASRLGIIKLTTN